MLLLSCLSQDSLGERQEHTHRSSLVSRAMVNADLDSCYKSYPTSLGGMDCTHIKGSFCSSLTHGLSSGDRCTMELTGKGRRQLEFLA